MAQYSSIAASTAVAGPRPLARCLSVAVASPGSRAIIAVAVRICCAVASARAARSSSVTAMMARDPGLATATDKYLASGRGPATAVDAAIEEYCAMFSAAGGYLAERVTDLRDVRDRGVARLLGLEDTGVPELTQPCVIVAHDLAPAETASLRRDLVLAIVTESGGPTSHTAILAAQMLSLIHI